jgi:RNA polymerase sigma-70 factor (ECF subfamily)
LFNIINPISLETDKLNTNEFLVDFNKRNKKAFKKVFDHYYAPLCYFAIRYVNDSDEVKDLVQNVFVNVWNKNNLSFINAQSLNSYLYSSVRNTCINYIRQKKLHREKNEEIILETQIENEFLQAKLENEVMTEIFKAIDELPEKCSLIFKYSYLYGMSNQQIADKLNISINTIKTQKMRAKKILKEKLKNVFHIVVMLRMGF